jgi:dihydrofolate reductase
MRKIISGVFQSLDGVMQAPGAPVEDPTGGFDQGGWTATFWDEKMGAMMGTLFEKPFDLLLGRKTYEIFAAHWPFVPAGDPIGPAFTKANKFVLTRGEDKWDWANTHKLRSIEDVAALKATEGPDLLIQGSSTLYPELLKRSLIDQMFVLTFPVVLGKGKRLFGAGTNSFAMKCVNSDVSSSGVILATYEPAGQVPLGSFALAETSDVEMKRRARMQREG